MICCSFLRLLSDNYCYRLWCGDVVEELFSLDLCLLEQVSRARSNYRVVKSITSYGLVFDSIKKTVVLDKQVQSLVQTYWGVCLDRQDVGPGCIKGVAVRTRAIWTCIYILVDIAVSAFFSSMKHIKYGKNWHSTFRESNADGTHNMETLSIRFNYAPGPTVD